LSEKHTPVESSSDGGHLNLRADCERCFALCCVAPTFSISADFPITKKAGQACPNLQPDFRCGIHPRLRQQGFRGCAVYDCFGAGQKVSQITFAGRDWRQAPITAKQMFEVFAIMRINRYPGVRNERKAVNSSFIKAVLNPPDVPTSLAWSSRGHACQNTPTQGHTRH